MGNATEGLNRVAQTQKVLSPFKEPEGGGGVGAELEDDWFKVGGL